MFKKIIVVVASGLLLAGCYHTPVAPSPTNQAPTTNTTTPESETTPTVTDAKIAIQGFAYTPKTLTVKPGATVTVTNSDAPGHSVTSDDGKSFDTGVFGQGKTTTFTAPTKVGSYPYHCTPHPNMKGTLVVAQ